MLVLIWTTVLPTTTIEQPSKLDDIFDNDSYDSDVRHTPPDSDVEADMERFPTFKETTKLEVGMTFKDKLQIRYAIKEYAMFNKKNFVFKKNDKKRIIVKCIDGYPFYIRFSMRTTNQYWQLVSLTGRHSCHRTAKNRQAKTDWLARNFVYIIRHTPEMKTKGLIAEDIKK